MPKIIEAKDLRCQKRQPLQDVIPLPAPFVVFIEPTNACNLGCIFCPTSDKPLLRKVGRPTGTMPMALFERVVSGLVEFGSPIKIIHLYKDGESLLVPRFPQMATMLVQAGVAEQVRLKTNGVFLNPSLNQQLIDSGIHWIGISIEAVSSEGYKKITGKAVDYGRLIDNIGDLYARRGKCEIYVKIVDAGLTPEEKDKFFSDFLPISDYCAIEQLMGLSYTDSKDFMLGTSPDTQDGLPLVNKKVCPYPFYSLCINFNGTASVCCADWAHGTVVGDASRESLRAIWNGERMRAFRLMQLHHRREEKPACRCCHYILTAPDNLDGFEARIDERLQEGK